MTRKRHPSSTTTAKVRRQIQRSHESNRALADRFGLNPKTVAKWKRRRSTEDSRSGPRKPTSPTLTPAEEALIVVFRRRQRLGLDDCFRVLKRAIPNLSRSALHRCLRRHGLSRIPPGNRARSPFGSYDSGRYELELYQLSDALGGGYLLFAISHLLSFVFAKPVDGFLGNESAEFLDELCQRAPTGVRRVQTGDHPAFAFRRGAAKDVSSPHPFAVQCRRNGISHFVVRSEGREPMKVLRGWKGLAMKTRRRKGDAVRRERTNASAPAVEIEH
jgi:transposase-like protein